MGNKYLFIANYMNAM